MIDFVIKINWVLNILWLLQSNFIKQIRLGFPDFLDSEFLRHECSLIHRHIFWPSTLSRHITSTKYILNKLKESRHTLKETLASSNHRTSALSDTRTRHQRNGVFLRIFYHYIQDRQGKLSFSIKIQRNLGGKYIIIQWNTVSLNSFALFGLVFRQGSDPLSAEVKIRDNWVLHRDLRPAFWFMDNEKSWCDRWLEYDSSLGHFKLKVNPRISKNIFRQWHSRWSPASMFQSCAQIIH